MLRRVTWHVWAATVLLEVAYLVLGWLALRSNGIVENWIYRFGLTGAALMPFVFIAAYSLTGQRWWMNDLGTGIVLVLWCFVPSFAPLAWVFWFNSGRLTNSMLGWIAVSGPAGATIAIPVLAFIFGRIGREQNAAKNGSPPGPEVWPPEGDQGGPAD